MSEKLPYALSSFIGRQAEQKAVSDLLQQHRLVTLTGPGGIGKTRLATAVAVAALAHYPDGIFFVDLATIEAELQVVQTVATITGLRETPGQERLDGLCEWLKPKRALLLLDNCEHLLLACAHLINTLLRSCPNLTILATSRESLGLIGEAVWIVPPLTLPAAAETVSDVRDYDAIRLFVDRATAVSPHLSLDEQTMAALAALCRKLDGLPLAIELAAAYARTLSITQITARLEENLQLLTGKDPTLPPRQQTLTAAFDWSYDGLTATEKALLRQLAVFTGNFTLTAVETICQMRWSENSESEQEPLFGMVPTIEVVKLLTQLVDKSLVVVVSHEPEPTYRLLALVRQYVREKLTAAGEAAAGQQVHAHYYAQLAQTAGPYMRSRHRREWQKKLENEYENLSAALSWFERNKVVLTGGEMVWSLSWFFYFRGTVSEASHFARALIDLPQAANYPDIQARLAWCIAAADWVYGKYKEAYEISLQGRQLAESVADHSALAYTLTLHGLMGALTDRGPQNIAYHQQAVTLFQKIGDRWGEALALYWQADTHRRYREHDQALAHFQQSQHLFQQLGDDWGMALNLQGMGAVVYRQGDYLTASQHLTTTLTIRRRSGDNWLTAQTLSTLATVLQAQGEWASAVSYFQEADKLYQEIGDDYGRLYTLFKLGELAQLQDDTTLARSYFQDCLTLAEGFEIPKRITTCQEALAGLEKDLTIKTGHPTLMITAFGSGNAHFAADDDAGHSLNWGYTRVKELFFYLLEVGPKTKAQIGLDLWPDASPARLRRNLHDALYQLRQVLGSREWILYENGRYTFNHDLPHQYDAAAFKRHVEAATIESLRQAILLFQDDFLTDFDSEWCFLQRENYRRAFVETLLKLGKMLMADGRYEAAADTYRQAISHDNLLEAAHRELMRALMHMGERAQAARQYQQLTQLLQEELGISPAEETIMLWQQLQQK